MKKVDLDVQERKETGKGKVGRLRKAGFVPAIVYGDNSKGLSVKIDKKILVHFLHAIGEGNVLTNLKIKGEKGISEQLVIIKDTQLDPVNEDILHLDFQRVSLTKKIISEVRIILKGESEGVKAGGMLDHALRTVQVECLPADMPERIEIDISTFKIHDGIHVKDLPVSSGVEMITDMERNVLSILPPRKIEVDEETIKTDEEPEVIGEKGKVEAETVEEAKKEEAGTAEEAKKEEAGKEEEKKGK
ncbi:50S ribosomal protein L25 [bacterium]|nr:50S ribosomal protein L25 [bacterium]